MTVLVVHSESHGSAVLVAAEGELDLDSAPTLREALARAVDESRAGTVLVDLSGVNFMDSTGLHALIWASRAAEQRGGWLRLVSPSPQVTRIIALTDLSQLLPAYDDLPSALASRPAAPAARLP